MFGGTFDPPHVGHVAAAANVRAALELDVVLMVVANEPWQKAGVREVSPAADRLAMVHAAVEGVEGVEASDIEIARGGPSYTADTLRALSAAGRDLFVIVGGDAAAGLTTWERAEEVREQASVVMVERGGDPNHAPPGWRVIAVDVPHLEVSSSDLRARVALGRPLAGLVPPAVAAYVVDRRLYRGAE